MTAIYARQSVEKKDSLSIEGQIELCRKYAEGEPEVFQDKGFSGKNTNRPAFQELMGKVELGEIQKIYVYRLDRFSRSIADFSRVWELLERHQVAFVSVTEQFDTSSPMGRAMLNIVMTFAQLERETTAERVKDNYRHRFRLGAWPGGPAPYGFDLGKVRTAEGTLVSTLTANDKADVVREVFTRYAEPGVSLRALARELTEQGIHGPKRESWDNVTLSRILHSPLYVRASEDVYWYYLSKGIQAQQEAEAFDGVHACSVIGRRDRGRNKYNGAEGQLLTVANHEGIVEAELWLKVQDKLEKNPQISRANSGKYSWLTGLMKCGCCGYAVRINYSKAEDKFYLLCSGRSNLASCRASIRVNLRELEEAVAGELRKVLADCPEEESVLADGDTADKLLAIEEKIQRLINALAESSEVSAVYISRQIDKLHKERETLTERTRRSAPSLQRVDFDQASFDEKKMIAREFIDRVLLEGEQVHILWKI